MTRTIQLYRTYSFKTKDPVIDELRGIVKERGASYAQITEACGVTGSCLRGWFHGETRRPQHATTKAVARALGYDYKLVRSNEYHFEEREPHGEAKERKKLGAQASALLKRQKLNGQKKRQKKQRRGAWKGK